MSIEWGIFNDESSSYHADEAVEAGFYSAKEAMDALVERYHDDDELVVRRCEEEDDDDEEEENDEDDGPYPIKY